MPLVSGAVKDPLAQDGYFLRRDFLLFCRWWWHALGAVLMLNAGEDLTLVRLAGNHAVARRLARQRQIHPRCLFAVEPEGALLVVCVGAMAGETAVGEDWAHMLIEADWADNRQRFGLL